LLAQRRKRLEFFLTNLHVLDAENLDCATPLGMRTHKLVDLAIGPGVNGTSLQVNIIINP
jgi:hypothetical protein